MIWFLLALVNCLPMLSLRVGEQSVARAGRVLPAVRMAPANAIPKLTAPRAQVVHSLPNNFNFRWEPAGELSYLPSANGNLFPNEGYTPNLGSTKLQFDAPFNFDESLLDLGTKAETSLRKKGFPVKKKIQVARAKTGRSKGSSSAPGLIQAGLVGESHPGLALKSGSHSSADSILSPNHVPLVDTTYSESVIGPDFKPISLLSAEIEDVAPKAISPAANSGLHEESVPAPSHAKSDSDDKLGLHPVLGAEDKMPASHPLLDMADKLPESPRSLSAAQSVDSPIEAVIAPGHTAKGVNAPSTDLGSNPSQAIGDKLPESPRSLSAAQSVDSPIEAVIAPGHTAQGGNAPSTDLGSNPSQAIGDKLPESPRSLSAAQSVDSPIEAVIAPGHTAKGGNAPSTDLGSNPLQAIADELPESPRVSAAQSVDSPIEAVIAPGHTAQGGNAPSTDLGSNPLQAIADELPESPRSLSAHENRPAIISHIDGEPARVDAPAVEPQAEPVPLNGPSNFHSGANVVVSPAVLSPSSGSDILAEPAHGIDSHAVSSSAEIGNGLAADKVATGKADASVNQKKAAARENLRSHAGSDSEEELPGSPHAASVHKAVPQDGSPSSGSTSDGLGASSSTPKIGSGGSSGLNNRGSDNPPKLPPKGPSISEIEPAPENRPSVPLLGASEVRRESNSLQSADHASAAHADGPSLVIGPKKAPGFWARVKDGLSKVLKLNQYHPLYYKGSKSQASAGSEFPPLPPVDPVSKDSWGPLVAAAAGVGTVAGGTYGVLESQSKNADQKKQK